MNIAVLGPSGAGKGTQAAKLRAGGAFDHLSAGDLLREAFERRSPLGVLAQNYISQGELVPDNVVDAIIAERVRGVPLDHDVLLDGFPRTPQQAEFLDELFQELGRGLQAAIFLNISETHALERFQQRLVCSHCFAVYHSASHPPHIPGRCDRCGRELHVRLEDTSPVARTRWRVFQRHIGPVLHYYANTNRLFTLDAEHSIEEVHHDLLSLLSEIPKGTARPTTLQPARTQLAPNLQGRQRPEGLDHELLNIILLGGPGSGKGTQAEHLKARFGLCHISSGELFRENLKNETPLGILARNYMNRGELVPDDITESMVEHRLSQVTGGGFLLDGFPRTRPQAEALTEMLDRLALSLSAVFYIRVSDDTLVNRLSGRWICRNCQAPYHLLFRPPKAEGKCDLCQGPLFQRDDDKSQTVRARLNTFHRQTEPLIHYYRDAGLLKEIDGEAEVETISFRLAELAGETRPAGEFASMVSNPS